MLTVFLILPTSNNERNREKIHNDLLLYKRIIRNHFSKDCHVITCLDSDSKEIRLDRLGEKIDKLIHSDLIVFGLGCNNDPFANVVFTICNEYFRSFCIIRKKGNNYILQRTEYIGYRDVIYKDMT